jgi:transcriptional regulator with XRE-family HTH domain
MAKKITQVEIAHRLGLDVSSINKILHGVPGLKWKDETVKAVFDTARELGYDLDKIKFRHNREYPRVPINLPAQIEIQLTGNVIIDRGTAKIKDLSLGGACLTELKLERDSIPIEPFWILIRPKGVVFKEEPLRAQIVRMTMNGRMELGVRFDNVDAAMAKILRKMMGL